jgi:hypothetical protein
MGLLTISDTSHNLFDELGAFKDERRIWLLWSEGSDVSCRSCHSRGLMGDWSLQQASGDDIL